MMWSNFDLFNAIANLSVIDTWLLWTVIVLFLCQIVVHAGIYTRVKRYRLMRKRCATSDGSAPISVVIPVFGEDKIFLEENIFKFIEQTYENKEIVIVYVGKDEDFYNEIKQIRTKYTEVNSTQINYDPKYPISVKVAINIGIKASRYDNIVISSTDCVPSSKNWLEMMSKGFSCYDVILGYTRIRKDKGLLNLLARRYNFLSGVQWISQAFAGHPSGASHNNFGFTKDLYYSIRGFTHLNMNAGEDDLFVKELSTKTKIGLVLTGKATCTETPPYSYKSWIRNIHHRGITRRFYPLSARLLTMTDYISRVLFYLICLACVLRMGLVLQLCIAVLFILRWGINSIVMHHNAKRLGEKGLHCSSILFDFTDACIGLYIHFTQHSYKEKAWL